ncbi:MAG TPA: DUF1054 family protein [Armatimonadota bacterium]|jgi:uncharacterized protein YktB (UPF0637 family)
MKFAGWTREDFAAFHITDFDERMAVLRDRIQPKLDALGIDLVGLLQAETGTEWYHHVAKHMRRSVNLPLDTWVALNRAKKGYKATVHFGVGLSALGANACLVVKQECVERESFAAGIEREVGVICPLLAASGNLYIGDVPNAAEEEMLPAKSAGVDDWIKRAEWLRNRKMYEFEMGYRIPVEEACALGSELPQTTLKLIREMLPLYQAGISTR